MVFVKTPFRIIWILFLVIATSLAEGSFEKASGSMSVTFDSSKVKRSKVGLSKYVAENKRKSR